ncbi:ABC transporter substrate-binding protein [Brachybacterium sp. AOP25-B2-12]|uniref:ABC transporter substrate-binding protein n=1 Tax=Brachybacterium sp. AOP25-B2-12 TaxID=3457710 RepID=UPI0040346922
MNAPRTPLSRRSALGLLGIGSTAAALAACSSEDPLAKESASSSDGGAATGALVVGSQAYYSNEIIAELFAQVIEKDGTEVKREYQIGQREVYLPELESGAVDIFPEYTGNLLQYLDKNAGTGDSAAVAEELASALPSGLTALPFAAATDQDSYNTTKEFAEQNSLKSLADLAGISGLKVAANSEFQTRPYGPEGLKKEYGADVELVPVEDSGGPLTVKALTDGSVQLADIYSADPSIAKNGFVTLEDPKALVLPQNVVPIVSKRADDTVKASIKKVTDALTTKDLIALNTQSVDEQKKSADIAKAWLTEKGLV